MLLTIHTESGKSILIKNPTEVMPMIYGSRTPVTVFEVGKNCEAIYVMGHLHRGHTTTRIELFTDLTEFFQRDVPTSEVDVPPSTPADSPGSES